MPFFSPQKYLAAVKCDFLVIGAGAVGLACARQLQSRGSTIIIEKNQNFGQETSSRNSEVIHSGIYYPVDSLKTKLCIRGQNMLYEYLKHKNIKYNQCGKWVVANGNQQEKLFKIKEHCVKLGVEANMQPKSIGQQLEPLIKQDAALVIPATGVFDSNSYMLALLHDFEMNGGLISYSTECTGIELKSTGNYQIYTNSDYIIEAPVVVNSAGLYADVIANYRTPNQFKLYKAKGHYYSTNKKIASRLIYPLPDKNLVTLGLHLTVGIDGRCKFGPDCYYQDNIDYTPNNVDIQKVYNEIGTYCTASNLNLQIDYTGIRPKLAGPGEPFRDFVIEAQNGFVNLVGIESPGLTSSMAIADHVNSII